MFKNLALIVFLTAQIFAFEQDKITKDFDKDNIKNKVILDSESLANRPQKLIKIGFEETYEKLPKLTFDSISEEEFNKYQPTNFLTKPKLAQSGDYFFIQTSKSKHKLKTYKSYEGKGWIGNEFLGYYPQLNLFAFSENSASEGIGFGELMLLDKKTDYQYQIISFGDGSVELPIPSKTNKYLLYYYNHPYQHKNSQIGVLKVNNKTKPQNYLKEYASYKSDDFAIEKIIWITDKLFYVKGYEETPENEKWVKKFKYYKSLIE